jgi:hypothetical protein
MMMPPGQPPKMRLAIDGLIRKDGERCFGLLLEVLV